MNRYIDTLESMVARQIESDPGSRDAIYERARRAIYETLGALDVEAARDEELRILDEAIAAVEKKVAAGKIVYEPPPAPEPEPESLRAALRPSLMEPLPPNESPQLRQADTRTPPLPAA